MIKIYLYSLIVICYLTISSCDMKAGNSYTDFYAVSLQSLEIHINKKANVYFHLLTDEGKSRFTKNGKIFLDKDGVFRGVDGLSWVSIEKIGLKATEIFVASEGTVYAPLGENRRSIVIGQIELVKFEHEDSLIEITSEIYKAPDVIVTKILGHGTDDPEIIDSMVFLIKPKKGNYYESIKDYTKGIELNPEEAEYYNLRAQVYRMMKRDREAKSDEKKYRELKSK